MSLDTQSGRPFEPKHCSLSRRRSADCATFPKGTGNGHHKINESSAMAVYPEVGSRNPRDLTTCSDIDMINSNADGRFVHKDGTPYAESWWHARGVRSNTRRFHAQRRVA